MKLEIRISLNNGADSESAPLIVHSNFNYVKEVQNSELYESIVADFLDALKERSS